MSTYLYGVVRASHPFAPGERTGVGRPAAPLRRVEAGDLAAIAGDAPAELRGKRRDLLAHEEVLEVVRARGTVLPMRFGVVAEDDDAVRADLRVKHARYVQLLSELDGRSEVNVKASHIEEAVLRHVLGGSAELRQLNEQLKHGGGSYEERLRFGEMVAKAVHDREVADAREIAERLGEHAVRRYEGDLVEGSFLNLSLLIDDEEAARFRHTVENVRDSLRELVELRVHGPLPPYSFVGSTGAA